MKSVYLLWHVHGDDEKVIGVYATEGDAAAAIGRLKQNPGFVDTPDGFHIDECQLNQDHWTEGYTSV
jgi:hypothetical protein